MSGITSRAPEHRAEADPDLRRPDPVIVVAGADYPRAHQDDELEVQGAHRRVLGDELVRRAWEADDDNGKDLEDALHHRWMIHQRQ